MCSDKVQTLYTVPDFSGLVKVLANGLKIPAEAREVIWWMQRLPLQRWRWSCNTSIQYTHCPECAHILDVLNDGQRISLAANYIFWCGFPLFVKYILVYVLFLHFLIRIFWCFCYRCVWMSFNVPPQWGLPEPPAQQWRYPRFFSPHLLDHC